MANENRRLLGAVSPAQELLGDFRDFANGIHEARRLRLEMERVLAKAKGFSQASRDILITHGTNTEFQEYGRSEGWRYHLEGSSETPIVPLSLEGINFTAQLRGRFSEPTVDKRSVPEEIYLEVVSGETTYSVGVGYKDRELDYESLPSEKNLDIGNEVLDAMKKEFKEGDYPHKVAAKVKTHY